MKAIKQMSLKLIALMLVVGISNVGLSGVGYTMAYYNDIESSTLNTFEAGSVDFLLRVSGWQATSTAVSMPPGDIVKKTVEIDPQDSNPFQYFATSTNFIGDSDFCTGLNVTATLEGVPMYNGSLTGLLTAATTTLNSWEFAYTTGVNDFQNRVCDFDIDYNGWQTRHDYPTFENGGFNDTEKVKNHLASWGFRINKVYYDVKTPERGAEGTNEWVEIYNQTNTDMDISGWKICDNTSCDILPTTPLIPAQKYAVIVATSTTATSTTVSNGLPAYWYLPSEVTQININNLIGNGLANDADMLILKRPDGVIVDQMNWGTPDTGWTNYNSNVWNPGATDVAEGNVLARVPSGYDTDAPSDWKELKPPSVDLIYPDEGGSYSWYWGYSYPITWTATNNNGADGDLDISIFYVKDVNHDGKISVGDTTHTIALTTANDGLFNWTLPSGFIGYIWIHLVATGPENPMLNTGTVSGKIYDPIPLFIGPYGIDPENLDLEAPVITLNGNNPALVPVGSTYNDLGGEVSDNVNSNLGYQTEGEADTNVLGEYRILYTASDQMGNVGTATRIVIVYDPANGLPDISGYSLVDTDSVVPPASLTDGLGDTGTTTSDTFVLPTDLGETASSTQNGGGNDLGTTTVSTTTDTSISTSTLDVILDFLIDTATSTVGDWFGGDDTATSTTATSTALILVDIDTATSTTLILGGTDTATSTTATSTVLNVESEEGANIPVEPVPEETASTDASTGVDVTTVEPVVTLPEEVKSVEPESAILNLIVVADTSASVVPKSGE